MDNSQLDCKKIFQKAFDKRYTWPDDFYGYKGRCIFQEKNEIIEGKFSLGKNFKPEIKNISQKEIVKSISSQLFEVVIHRVKKDFDTIHSSNNFQFLRKSDYGIEMKVKGKNEGDKYRVKDDKINMVYRKIHGIIIEIFVEEFLNTGNGILSKKYTSQTLNPNNLSKKSPKLKYVDNFIKLENKEIWILESRTVSFLTKGNEELSHHFKFKDLELHD